MQIEELMILGGEDASREICSIVVYVKDGVVYDMDTDAPFTVEKTEEEFLGWVERLDGPVYQLNGGWTLPIETSEKELRRIGVKI